MSEKKILLLGSGYVAAPCVDYLLRNENNIITIASYRLERSVALSNKYDSSRVHGAQVDVNDEASLDNLVSKHDLVISLIPYIHHVKVINSAIRYKKNVVTTSYVSPAMLELDEKCKQAGITVMNEIGLDPGVDHIYAVKAIRDAHAEGKQVKSFTSFCGGLPAPEASNNPLGYKFSWSSRGVLLALRNDAKFLKNGKIQEVNGKDLMRSVEPINIFPAFSLVSYANRDSSFYNDRYSIPEAETVVRGSLRYSVFPPFVQALVDLGLLDDSPKPFLDQQQCSWMTIVSTLLNLNPANEEELQKSIISHCKLEAYEPSVKEHILKGMKWLGFFSEDAITTKGNLLDTLCNTLEEKMTYKDGERDMIILQHRFDFVTKEGKKETLTSTLLEYGEPNGYSAMARTVGVPCGIATQLILDGILTKKGVLAPIDYDMLELFLPYLEKENIICHEEFI
ncbi:saccharopine dehydrogenase [Neoconidiobolus thromboides FSU 785]|nr:saccharopine dehydrogenase [Neoconidiobolus thromboides FSU 785]